MCFLVLGLKYLKKFESHDRCYTLDSYYSFNSLHSLNSPYRMAALTFWSLLTTGNSQKDHGYIP